MGRPNSLAAALLASMLVVGCGTVLVDLDPATGSASVWAGAGAFLLLTLASSWNTARRRPAELSFMHVMVLLTAGAWIAYLTSSFGQDAVGGYAGDADAILVTLLQSILGCLVTLGVFTWLTTRKWAGNASRWLPELMARLQSMPARFVWGTLGAHLALTAYSFSQGTVMSGTGIVMAEASVFQSTVLQLGHVVSSMATMLGFMLALVNRVERRRLGFVVVAVQLLLAFLFGRRVLLAVVVLGAFLVIAARGLNFQRIVLVAVAMAFTVLVAMPAFLMLRDTAQEQGIQSEAAGQRSGVLLGSIRSVTEEFSVERALNERFTSNVQHRLGFLDWTVMLQTRLQDGWEMRGGEIFAISMLENVPRLIWPEKLAYLGHEQIEQKIQHWFRMPEGDGASTLLGYGIADGGFVGVVFYAAMFGVVLGLLMRLAESAHFPLFALWAASAAFLLCFNIEGGVPDMIGAMRMYVVVLILDWQLRRLRRTPRRMVREPPRPLQEREAGRY